MLTGEWIWGKTEQLGKKVSQNRGEGDPLLSALQNAMRSVSLLRSIHTTRANNNNILHATTSLQDSQHSSH